jgi:predicted metal-dependent hydrolase
MDHSPAFWNMVQSVLPDYTALRRELKQERLPAW